MPLSWTVTDALMMQYGRVPVPVVQLGIGDPIDLAHAPLADEDGDVVMAESGADCEYHGLMWLIVVTRASRV